MALRHADSGDRQVEAALALALVAESAGRYAEGQAVCETALEAVDSAGDSSGQLRSLRRMRERLRAHQGVPAPQSLAACHALLTEAEAAGDERERVALLTFISEVDWRASASAWPSGWTTRACSPTRSCATDRRSCDSVD
jgi:hypothetical protein